MRIVIANAHSIANAGDVAIVLGTLKIIREKYPDAKITIVSRTSKLDEGFYNSLGCDVVSSVPNIEVLLNCTKLGKLMRMLSAFKSLPVLNRTISSADIVMLCGGGYYYSDKLFLPGLNYISNLIPVYLAKLHKVKLISLPQSYGPLRSWLSRWMFKKVLDYSFRVFAREEISKKYLETTFGPRSNVFIAPDLAFYLARDVERVPIATKVVVGVTVRKWGKDDKYIYEIAKALRGISESHDLHVKVIVQVRGPADADDDLAPSKILTSLLEKCGVSVELLFKSPAFTVSELNEIYSTCNLVLGMRFHSVILSMCNGVPALAVGYQHKSKGILELHGLEDLYVGTSDDANHEKIQMKVLEAIKNHEALQSMVIEATKSIRGKEGII